MVSVYSTQARALGAVPLTPACSAWISTRYNFAAFEDIRRRAGELLARAPSVAGTRAGGSAAWTPDRLYIDHQVAIDYLTEVSQLFSDGAELLNLPRFFLVPGPSRYFRHVGSVVEFGDNRVLPQKPSFATAIFDPLTGTYNPAGVSNLEKMKSWWRAPTSRLASYVGLSSAAGLTRLPTWFCGPPFVRTHWWVWGMPFAATVPQILRDRVTRDSTEYSFGRRRVAECGEKYSAEPWNKCRGSGAVRGSYSTYAPTIDDCFGYPAFGKRYTVWMGAATHVLYATQLLRALMGETGEQKVVRAFKEWSDELADITRQVIEAYSFDASAPGGSTDRKLMDSYNSAVQVANTAGQMSGNVWVQLIAAAGALFGLFAEAGRGYITGSRTDEAFYPGRYQPIQYKGQMTFWTPPLPYNHAPPEACGLLSATGEGSTNFRDLLERFRTGKSAEGGKSKTTTTVLVVLGVLAAAGIGLAVARS